MLNFYKPSNAIVVVKMGLRNYYKCSTNFVVHKTGLTITYRASTTFELVNTGLANMCATLMGFFAVKNTLPSFYNFSTSFAVVKAAFF